ncbi:MAG: hypothetical protein ABJ004_14980 [Cyclobacteriaceae bacterium]
MKKFLKNIALSIVVLPLLYAVLLFVYGLIAPGILRKNMPYGSVKGHLYTRLQETKTYGACDVVVLGSSHAYRGFDPRIFKQYGLKMFNLGSSAQTPVQSKILVKRHLDKLDPRFVIIETYPAVFQADGVQPAIDLISNDHIDGEVVWMVLRMNNIRVLNTLLYGLMRQLLGLEPKVKESKKDQYISGGYVERTMQVMGDPIQSKEQKRWSFDSTQVRAFESLIQMFDQKGIPFILVQAPMSQPFLSQYTNGEDIDEYFSGLDENYTNFNKVDPFENKYFYSETHLNQKGVEKFNRILLNELQQKGLIN